MRWSESAGQRAEDALIRGFEAFDRAAEDGGFWSPYEGVYMRSRLGARGQAGAEAADLRYTPFGLAGALRAHRRSGVGKPDHLRRAAQWCHTHLDTGTSLDSLYYGGLWSLAEASATFHDVAPLDHALVLFERTRTAFLASPDLNYGVGLYGLAQLAEMVPGDAGLRDAIAIKAHALARVIDARGYPLGGDRRAPYHQRLMYSCWGLLGAARCLEDSDLVRAARRILDPVSATRIDADGGIRWHATLEWRVTPRGWPRLYPYGAELYYECHQCFYLIAVQLLDALEPIPDMAVAERVFAWIFGANRWGIDLTRHGVDGLPVRCVSRRGVVAPRPNRFKGAYEVGAYLWQMANVVGDRRRVA